MSNLTQDVPPQPYGLGGFEVYLPQEAAAQIYQGAMLATAADGGVVTGTTAGSGHCIGVAVFGQLGGSTLGAVRMAVWTDKIFIFQPGTFAPTDLTPYGTVLWMETDNTVGTGSGTETQIAGRFMGFEDDGRIRVFISNKASWFDANANQNDGGTAAFKARAVVTSLPAYAGTTTGVLTASANGALAAQDGVTIAVGDVVFVQGGTTNLTAASDSGPYVATAIGGASAKWVFTRPAWWQTGAAITVGQLIEVGGEGTNYAGSQWKTFAAKASVVDTTDPLFYVREFTSAVTLAAGFIKLGVSQTFPGLFSATKTGIAFTSTSAGNSLTVSYRAGAYASGGSATAAGYMGTSTVSITALVAAGTIEASDTSTGQLTITNW